MKPWHQLLVFNILWFVCVLGGTPWAIGALCFGTLAHFFVARPSRRERAMIAQVALVGIGVDWALYLLGVLSLESATGFLPIWLVVLWVLFSLTLNHGFAWLRRSVVLSACVGAVAGPMSYWGGASLGALQLGGTQWTQPQSLMILALVWAGLMAWACRLIRWVRAYTLYPSPYRIDHG